MRVDVVHELCPNVWRFERWQRPQNGEQATDNDHQCWRFDAYSDNFGVGRTVFQSKGISEVSSMVNESENDQGCEYDI